VFPDVTKWWKVKGQTCFASFPRQGDYLKLCEKNVHVVDIDFHCRFSVGGNEEVGIHPVVLNLDNIDFLSREIHPNPSLPRSRSLS
jgi:hypothetical protein